MPPRDAEVAPTPADARPPDVDAMLARHLSTLHAFVRLRAGPALLRHESSADLAQSVCRELLRRRDRFRYGGEPEFRRWLFTTAARKIAKRRAYHRAEKRDAARRSPLSPGESPQADDAVLLDAYRAISTPSAKLAAGEQVARIEAALAKLSEERREIVLLSRMGGLTHREIAEYLGKSEAACRVMLHRALAELSASLVDRSSRDGRS